MKIKYIEKSDNLKNICKICGKQTLILGGHVVQAHHLTCKEYYDSYIKTPNEGICPICGKETTFRGITKGGYIRHCSYSCAQKDEEVTKKKQITSKKLHGVENYRNTEQAQKTFNENHPIETQKEYYKKIIEKRDSVDDKIKEKWKNKARNTRYDKNGEGNWLSDESIKQIKETKKDRYGDENYNNKEKATKTCLKLWGKIYPPNYKYTYNGINFDSSWEIAYFIWLKDHKINFIYQPKDLNLKYTFNGKEKTYYPDFIVNDFLVEIKSPVLYKRMLIEGTSDNEKYKLMLEKKCINFIYIRN